MVNTESCVGCTEADEGAKFTLTGYTDDLTCQTSKLDHPSEVDYDAGVTVFDKTGWEEDGWGSCFEV